MNLAYLIMQYDYAIALLFKMLVEKTLTKLGFVHENVVRVFRFVGTIKYLICEMYYCLRAKPL